MTSVKLIAVANHKGGSGKTPCAYTISKGMALRGKKVLAVDCDAQGNLTNKFFTNEFDRVNVDLPDSIAHDDGLANTLALFRPTENGGDIAQPHRISDNFYLIGSRSSLHAAEKYEIDVQQNFWDQIFAVVDEGNFDIVVFDCPPAAGVLQSSAVMVSTHVLCPTALTADSFAGVQTIVNLIRQLKKRINPDLELLGIVLTRVKNSSSKSFKDYHRQVIDTYGNAVLDSMLSESVEYENASMNNLSIEEHLKPTQHRIDKHTEHKVFKEVTSFMNEVISRLGLTVDKNIETLNDVPLPELDDKPTESVESETHIEQKEHADAI